MPGLKSNMLLTQSHRLLDQGTESHKNAGGTYASAARAVDSSNNSSSALSCARKTERLKHLLQCVVHRR
jgi:hypothetical protein